MLLFKWNFFWQPSKPTVSFQYTHSMHLLGQPAYMKMWIILFKILFIYSEITLNCAESRKGLCVKLFTKVHPFDLVLTHTDNMTSHYVGVCQNTKT